MSSSFNLGDSVYVTRGPHRGLRGKITYVYPNTIQYIVLFTTGLGDVVADADMILDNGVFAMNAHGQQIMSGGSIQPATPTKFQIGDKITTKGQDIYEINFVDIFLNKYTLTDSGGISIIHNVAFIDAHCSLVTSEYSSPGVNTVVSHSGDLPNGLSICQHKWTFYQGFNDSFEYCSMCDEKRK